MTILRTYHDFYQYNDNCDMSLLMLQYDCKKMEKDDDSVIA